MSQSLYDQLRSMTVVVADTGDSVHRTAQEVFGVYDLAATETAAARNGRGGASRPATGTARHA